MAAQAALGPPVTRRFLSAWAALAGCVLAGSAQAASHFLIVSGIGGLPEYEQSFADQAEAVAAAAARSVLDDSTVVRLSGDAATRDALTAELERLAAELTAADTLTVVLIGHGSYDGSVYKYNLPGPDIDGAELGRLLGAIDAGTQFVVNATSASGAVLEDWSGGNRIVVTATRSGAERNATRFAEHFAAALSSDAADIDKDGLVDAQEAFDFAARSVADSYETEGTLATEHPQIDGSGAASFIVARLSERRAETPEIEDMLAELDALEGDIAALRARRGELDSERYMTQLQDLLVELALVQQRIDAARGE